MQLSFLILVVILAYLAIGHVTDVQQDLALFTFQVAYLIDAATHDLELLGEVALHII